MTLHSASSNAQPDVSIATVRNLFSPVLPIGMGGDLWLRFNVLLLFINSPFVVFCITYDIRCKRTCSALIPK